MTPEAILIATFLLITSVFVLNGIAEMLNLRAFTPRVPPEFQGVYEADRYRKAGEYLGINTRFGLIQDSFFYAVGMAFILLGGFGVVDALARSFALGPVWSGLIFFAVIGILRQVLALPFTVYDTFVIEARFGFNRTTPRTFLMDLIKGTVLGALLGGAACALVLFVFEKAGTHAWWIAWAALAAFQLLVAFVAPALLLPLFNRFEPLPEGTLKEAVLRYVSRQGFRLKGVFTMDGSRRSSKANAFFTGFGRFRRLVLFDTLIAQQTEDELMAVLAHEVGHYRHGHIVRSILLSLALSAGLFFVAGVLMREDALYSAFGVRVPSIYAGLALVVVIVSPILRFLGILTNWLSRRYEYQADAFARETTGRPDALVSALKKLSVDHLATLTPHPLKVIFDYSHPPVLKRIQALQGEKAS